MIDYLFPDLSKRINQMELMDDINSNPIKLVRTIKQFRLLNHLFTRSRTLMKKYFFRDMVKQNKKQYTLLDIGAGGCDLDVWFLNFVKKNNINLKVFCLDNDDRIIDYARQTYSSYPEIKIIKGNVFQLHQLPDFDYIFANHFLHHFEYEQINEILSQVYQKTRCAFLLNDLKRSPAAYLGYTLFTALFIHNSFAFYDGRLSIRRGFTRQEIQTLIRKNPYSKQISIFETAPARIVFHANKNGDSL